MKCIPQPSLGPISAFCSRGDKGLGALTHFSLDALPPWIPGEKGRTSEEGQLGSAPGRAQTSLGSGWDTVPSSGREGTVEALPSLLPFKHFQSRVRQ